LALLVSAVRCSGNARPRAARAGPAPGKQDQSARIRRGEQRINDAWRRAGADDDEVAVILLIGPDRRRLRALKIRFGCGSVRVDLPPKPVVPGAPRIAATMRGRCRFPVAQLRGFRLRRSGFPSAPPGRRRRVRNQRPSGPHDHRPLVCAAQLVVHGTAESKRSAEFIDCECALDGGIAEVLREVVRELGSHLVHRGSL
jgi:hypothetical protein